MDNKKILVLGGTQMLGRDFVETLCSNNSSFTITLANRGVTNPSLFHDLKKLKIDRDQIESYITLNQEQFDIVVDFSCYTVDHLISSLKNIRYKKYILISTQSVFDTNLIDSNDYSNSYWRYCYNKKQIENLIHADHSINNIALVRPCAVYGDHDYTYRFEKIGDQYYWRQTGTKVSDTNGCVFVRRVTEKIIELLHEEQSERISYYNIG
jgi:nucleoside-diphosphate-sugar epimerase